MAENRFLQSPLSTNTTPAPVAPPTPDIQTLPPRSSGPLTSAVNSLNKGILPPVDLQPLFEKSSAEYGVPLNVLSALAQQESSYNPSAIGEMTKWGQAKGLMQNLDNNSKALGIDPYNPEQAIAGAARQLRERLDKGYSMEEAVKAHFGGDNRAQWGEKTNAYGQEVLAKASIIGSELMANKPKAAPGNDLAAIQAELDAKEPGRYKVIDPADIAERDAKRADIASGKDALSDAQAAVGGYDAPSPYTLENQQRIEDKVNAAPAPSPLTPKNQALAKAGFAPVPDQPEDGFVSATQKSLQNVPEHFKNAVGGIIRTQGEGIDDQSLVSNAVNAGIIQRMQDNGDIIMVQNDQGQMTPTLRDGSNGDVSSLAKYLRTHAAELMTPEEAGAMVGMKPNEITALGKRLSKEANRDTVQINPDGPLAKYGSMIIGSTVEMVPALAASVITKNPAVGMSMIGGQVYGQSYDTARSKNLNPNDAATYAMAQAAAEAIPEYLPIHVIMQPGQQFFKGLFKAGAAEALQESVTQAIQSGLDKGSIDPNMTWAQAREQIADAAIVGAGSGAALKAGVHGIQKAVDAIPARNREAEAAAAAQDTPQAEPAPTDETQQAQAPQAETAPEAPAPAPTGPLTRAAAQHVAPEPTPAPAGEPVTVRSSDGEMAGTLESYQEDGQGGWSARVLADDGNAYDFTQDDGVQLERASAPTPAPEPSAQPAQGLNIPTSGPVGKIPTLTDVVKPGVEIPTLTEQVPTLKEVVPTLKNVVTPEGTPDYSVMDAPQLRAALKETATAIKAEPKNASLKAQRKAIETAIKNLVSKPAAPAVQELTGDKIDKEWTRFADDSGSLNIPRADMPQIKAEHRGAMTNFLNARGIAHTQEEVPASSLKPTQEEFSPAKVKKAIGFDGGDRSILVSSDGHVLDGHHQWLAKLEANEPVKVIRLDAPIKQLLDAVKEFPSAEQAKGATAAPAPTETKPAKPASETPKAASPAPETASKPKTPKDKAKARKEKMQRTTLDTLGVNVDDQFTVSGNVGGYVDAGKVYTLDNIDSAGTAHVRSATGSTSLSVADLLRAKHDGVSFTKVESGGRESDAGRDDANVNKSTPDSVSGVTGNLDDLPERNAIQEKGFQSLDIDVQRRVLGKVIDGINDFKVLDGVIERVPVDVVNVLTGKNLTTESLRGNPSVLRAALTVPLDKPVPTAVGKIVDAVLSASKPVASPPAVFGSVSPREGGPAVETDAAMSAIENGHGKSSETIPANDSSYTSKEKPQVSDNTVFTESAADKARALLKSKLGQLNSGVDPEILQAGITLAGYHIEKGARTFAAYAKAMTEDLGDMVKPYLKSWYMGVKYDPRASGFDGMSSAAEVEGFDVDVPATEAKNAPVQPEPTKSKTHVVTTPSGREFEVRSKVVEAKSLVTSNNADGSINPHYPQELQPRDRSRSASMDQINEIAGKLNPRLLGDSASATDGAPIVDDQGVVESGNGRTLAIRQAYARGTEPAQKYRDNLEAQGYDVADMEAPVLVRERVTPMTTEERQAYTTEANERTTLALSSTERAVADAKKMGDILHLFNGGDVAGAANREFVRAFIGDVASKSDRGSLMDGEGLLSQDGRRRIEAALLAAAYDDPALVNDIFESADSDIKSIGGALLDAAGPWAQMRQEARDGQIAKGADLTKNLMEAVNLVRQARAQGKSVFEMVNQNDIFSGELDQATKDWVSVFYRGASLARARSRDKVADALLTYTQLARATQPGDNLFGEPELTGADLLRGTHDKLDRQEAQANQQQNLFGGARPDDATSGARREDGRRPAPGAGSEATQEGGEVNAASTRAGVERNRADGTPAKPVDETAVSDEPGTTGRRSGKPGASTDESRADGQRDQRLPADGATARGERSDQLVHQPDGAFRPTVSDAGSVERARSGGDSRTGKPVERERTESIVETAPATDASEFGERLAAQKKAAGTKTVRGDKANIDKALPLLLDPQRDDVLKAEQRFAVGNGMLLTNGTGTGKTASGMGVIVRSINAGKPNAIVIVPSDKIASDWVKFAKMVGVDLKQLDSTTDNGGDGQVVTTYANFGANESLAQRDWDQVVADEAHYLSSNEQGAGTAALTKLQALTGHPDGFYTWVRQRHPQEWGAYREAMNASRDAAKQDSGVSETQKDKLAEVEAELKKAWDAIEQPARAAWEQRWSTQADLPKTLFLSATPFAYVKSVDFAEGYLFDYTPPAERFSNKAQMAGYAYNSGDAREKFFMQHFGYRMRYNKLTAPEAGVDSELMEQNFNQHLKDVGALSGRRLEVPYDYDRKFVMVDDAVGQKIDQGLAYLREHADGKYREVYKAVMDTFDYQRRMYLLESIKAKAVVPMIQAHLKLGRKVVVFHDYNKGGGFDPFSEGLSSITDQDVRRLAREAFDSRPDIFKKIDLRGLFSPIATLSKAFPDALFFNGTVPKKQRRLNADTFNDDTSGKDLIVLQSDAGREGVSLHDTTGKHMRVLINLGMPGKPVAAIQIEGRTYRTGQASDAAFRYLTTGTAWEASVFASKIAERASTAENLALGTEARGLKQSFIDAYNGAEDLAPSADDGKGGKELDRELGASSALSPFNKAKAYYFAQQKNSKRRDQREGVDYFATPEPVGFKMAEWANIQKGDDVLEPSAGHGAIARFFPPQTNVTMVEPSYDLSQRAALANGQARIVNDNFEALHLTNKYDAVVMNPPYGSGGKTAIEHLSKAAKHLREGGRVVALIPHGGLSDKRLAAFLESEEAQSLHMVADITMPASTFERAGTTVNTHVVVLEKHSNPDDATGIHARNIDLSNAESTTELFDRIEHLDLPDRAPTSKPEPKVELIEHVTGKGKTLTGIVRTDLTKDEAKEIDPFTFPKNGGWFIRSKHLGDGTRLSVATPVSEPATHQEVQDAITQGPFGPVVKKLIDSGNIVIHGNVQSLPDGIPQVRGTQALTTPDGKVHLIAVNLTPGNANAVLLHEMFHSGGETLVGSQRWAELNDRLDSLYRQAEQSTGKAREVFDRARQRVDQARAQGAVADGMSAEEFGAYAIEEYEQLPKAFRKWVDDLVGAIKHWLFSRYGKQLGQVTPAQLRAMAKDALVSIALDKRGELFGPAGNMFSVKLDEVFPDIAADADATSFGRKIGPERLPQRMADRWRQLTDNLGLRFRQAAVDRYAPLMVNDKKLYGADTLEGSIASSSWVLARMSQAAGGAVDAMLNNGRIYLDPQEKVIDLHANTQGLGDVLKKLGSTAEMTRFMGWIAANRSKRLLGEGRENLFTPEEIEAGIRYSGGRLENGRSRSILYQQVWKEFQQHRDDVLGIAEQAGIITPEQRATWSDEFYVPFYRVLDAENLGGPTGGSSGLSRQQAYKKLKGGKQHLNDLLENTLLNFHHLIQASLKNQAASMAMINAEQLGIADKTTEAKRDKDNSTFVMEGGEKQWYNVSDPLTFKAVSAITDAGVNTMSRRIMRGFKRFFTNMTTITPQFVVANAIRDTLSAMATSPTSAVPLKTAFQGALTYGNNHKRAQMMASGGAFHFGQAYGSGASEFKASLNGTMRTAQVLKDPMLIPGTLMKAWRKYHEVTDFAENMNRAGIWAHNQDKGKLKAAFEARDLMDFSAHGDAGIVRFFTDVVPFLNARIQGLDKLYRSGGKPALKTLFGKGTKSDKQAFARFAAVIGALTVFSVMLYLRNKDDEDYRKLEDWQRDTYWPIKIGNSMFFIPKPFEVGSIATMGERLMEQFTDPTVGGDKLASRALSMLTDTFAMNPTPQAIKPLLELGYNENTFTGRPIEDQSMQRLSPSLRARPETTRLAEASSRGIEAALGTVGKGDSALSPVQIDHLIQGYMGAVGATAVGMADTFWRRAQGEELPARHWDEYQPVKRFYKDLTREDNYTRYGTDFYNALKKSDQAYANLQHLVKYGEEERAAELEQKQADVLALRSTLNKVNRGMAQINAEMKRVQMDKAMDGATKRLELDRLRSMRNLMTEEVGKDLEQEKVTKRAASQ